MEALGVPWFVAVRELGPPLFLLAAGGALLLWRRPARQGAAWAALAVNLAAAALPYLWLGLQLLTGQAERTVYGLLLTLVQPAVVALAWALLLFALVAPARDGRRPQGPDAPARESAHENIG
ncbi:hypothetical protein [Nocardiopsis sp. CNT312]|uniref:hypothetical protein n=1 Tax=Nocardiopsis sp. CNT312 TaxID=1137268 RepID=UPI000490E6DF|nr:hypothetical protein [Nocardiopsis sp. CNT312]